MKLERAGFYKELTHGAPGGGSFREQGSADVLAHRSEIVRYLEGGRPIVESGGRTKDAETGELTPYNLAVQTDGTWAWPSDLPHYVAQHGSALPAEFVAHMQARGWQCPHLSDAELAQAAERF